MADNSTRRPVAFLFSFLDTGVTAKYYVVKINVILL